jgi:hypothetical protein
MKGETLSELRCYERMARLSEIDKLRETLTFIDSLARHEKDPEARSVLEQASDKIGVALELMN